MAIELRNVKKSFGSVEALRGVSLRLEEGRVYGLLGNNGAGKTTMLNIITNRIYPSSGEVLLDGESVFDNDRALGKLFMMGEQNLYPDDMRVRDAIKLSGSFYKSFDMDAAMQLAESFKLPMKSKIRALSTGYASIFRLVLALSVNTPYVIFDEPVLGLDAQHRDIFYRLLMERCAAGNQTVVISTHLIQEAADLIEHAIIIKDGELIRSAPVEELSCAAHTVSGPAGAVESYIAGRSVLSRNALGGLLSVCIEGEPGETGDLLEISAVNLQDYFIGLMSREEEK